MFPNVDDDDGGGVDADDADCEGAYFVTIFGFSRKRLRVLIVDDCCNGSVIESSFDNVPLHLLFDCSSLSLSKSITISSSLIYWSLSKKKYKHQILMLPYYI
ncbi:hypothetical protein DERP_009760 [Dermatophagoides pteronyssinus]|uniref:Uncharacterized protein n=1 Tax=Dermatophagoides pteronyssinus TaxID=6956 RepID=A0ABQ8IR70_DERPT|nr:hypothetical protein DERP_009760 [Dermatophagoides pteronyssinus]